MTKTTAALTYRSLTVDGLAAEISDTEADAIAALTGEVTIAVRADENEDDCLADAADRVSAALDLDRDLAPRWQLDRDGSDSIREYVLVTVPASALHEARGVEQGEVSL